MNNVVLSRICAIIGFSLLSYFYWQGINSISYDLIFIHDANVALIHKDFMLLVWAGLVSWVLIQNGYFQIRPAIIKNKTAALSIVVAVWLVPPFLLFWIWLIF